MDEFIEQLLSDPSKAEALEWLKSTPDGVERVLGEMCPDKSLREIEELYALGAATVWAIEIDEDDDLEGTGKLVIELPDDAELRKKVFEWAGSWACRQGFEKDKDTGQTHLFAMLD